MAMGLGVGGLMAARLARASRAIEFAGMTVVMFGGSRGLGLVMARELGAEGARLVLIARDQDELGYAAADLVERGASVSTLVCDIRNRDQVEATLRRIAREHLLQPVAHDRMVIGYEDSHFIPPCCGRFPDRRKV